MKRKELVNLHGEEICELCRKSEEYRSLALGMTCEGDFCERAQDEYANENDITLED